MAQRHVIDLDDQPVIVLKKGGRDHEFPADDFMLRIVESGITSKEMAGQFLIKMVEIIKDVTTFEVGPLVAREIYLCVLNTVKAVQKKEEQSFDSDTTTDSAPTTSETSEQ